MPAILRTGTVISTTAGVPTQASNTSKLISSVIFQAGYTNTGKVYYGDSSVTTTNGIGISAGETLEISFDNQYGNANYINLNSLYFDTDTTGNTVRIAYIFWVTVNALS